MGASFPDADIDGETPLWAFCPFQRRYSGLTACTLKHRCQPGGMENGIRDSG